MKKKKKEAVGGNCVWNFQKLALFIRPVQSLNYITHLMWRSREFLHILTAIKNPVHVGWEENSNLSLGINQ